MFSSPKIPDNAESIIREWYKKFDKLLQLEVGAFRQARTELYETTMAQLRITFENNEENLSAYLHDDSVKVMEKEEDLKIILADQYMRAESIKKPVFNTPIIIESPPLQAVPLEIIRYENSKFKAASDVEPTPQMEALTKCINELVGIMRRVGKDQDEDIRDRLTERLTTEWKRNNAAMIEALQQPGVRQGKALMDIARWVYSGDDDSALKLLLPGVLSFPIKKLDDLFVFLKNSVLLELKPRKDFDIPLYEADSMEKLVERTINHGGIIDSEGREPANVYDLQQLLMQKVSSNVALMDIISENRHLENRYGKPQAQISKATVQMLVDFAASGSGFTADLQMDASVRDSDDDAHAQLIYVLDELKKKHEREWYNLMGLNVSGYGASKLNEGLEALKRGMCLNSYKRGMAQCLFENFDLSAQQKQVLYKSYENGTDQGKTSKNWNKGSIPSVKITEKDALNKEEENWQHYFNICAAGLRELSENIDKTLNNIDKDLTGLEKTGVKKQTNLLVTKIDKDRDPVQIEGMLKIERDIRKNKYDLMIEIKLLESSLARIEQVSKAMGGGGDKELEIARRSLNKAKDAVQKLDTLMGFLENIENNKIQSKKLNNLCDEWMRVTASVHKELRAYNEKSSKIRYKESELSSEIQMAICVEIIKFISIQNAQAKKEELNSAALYSQYNGSELNSKVILPSSKGKYKGPKQSDDRWLDNAEISRLFEILGHGVPANVTFMEGLTLSPSIVGAPIETQAAFICDSLNEQIKQMRLANYNDAKLYMPLNLGQNHWVLLECTLNPLDNNKATFTFIDSINVAHKDFLVAQAWIKAIGNTLFSGIQNQDFHFMQTGQQADGCSCGYITIQNALDRANGLPALSVLQNAPAQDLTNMRMSFLSNIYGAENVIQSQAAVVSSETNQTEPLRVALGSGLQAPSPDNLVPISPPLLQSVQQLGSVIEHDLTLTLAST